MTGDEFEAAIKKLGMSQRGAGRARFFGVGERQIRKWVSEESRIPESAKHLIRIMIKHKLTVDDVEKLARK